MSEGIIHDTLISSESLAAMLDHPKLVMVDCRFTMEDPARGTKSYLESHIPGAVHADMDEHLTGSVVLGKTGRHPLPDAGTFAHTLSRWGIGRGVQVVAYDDRTGAAAARLWWMLRWLGHREVAVLDGGFACWCEEGRLIRAGAESREARKFKGTPRQDLVVGVDEMLALAGDPLWRVIDSRTAERYLGKTETVYPVAGHIPGASNAPNLENLEIDGRFKSRQVLRERFVKLVGAIPAHRTVFYCGAGVTAAHNALAFAHCGLGEARLFVGSWSEWIADPARPIELGAPPLGSE